MVILWLWSCVIVGLCSAQCKKENIIFTGDDKSVWVADIEGESKPGLLAPKKIPIFVKKEEGTIEVTVHPHSAAIELLAVSLETKNFQNIDVLGKTKTLPSANSNWVKSNFIFERKLVDHITVLVKTDNHKAALRSIYVEACVVEDPIQKIIRQVLMELRDDVLSEKYDKVRKLYYTDNVIRLIQGEEVTKGKDAIEEYLRRTFPSTGYLEFEFLDSERLSKTSAFCSFEATFFEDETMTTLLKPSDRMLIVWQREDNRWKIDQLALNDGEQCDEPTP